MKKLEGEAWLHSSQKRAIDVGVAAAMTPLAWPLESAAAFAVQHIDHVEPYFEQERVGYDLETILIPKLRTLRGDIDSGMSPRRGHHPRGTVLGNVLRRTHIDELPQRKLVLEGKMAVVGPRPIVWPEVCRTLEVLSPAEKNAWMRSRKIAKPGLFSLYDLRSRQSGATGTYRQRADDDIEYAETASLVVDTSILVKGMGVVAFTGLGGNRLRKTSQGENT